jgi:hypothetical protein
MYNLIAWVFQGVAVGMKYTPLFLPPSHPPFVGWNTRNSYAGTSDLAVILPLNMWALAHQIV